MEDRRKETINEVVFDGRYKVCDKIREGGYGRVFVGIDLKTNEKVAIKVDKYIYKEDEHSSIYKEVMFLREMEVDSIVFQCIGYEHGHGRLKDGTIYGVFDLLGLDLFRIFRYIRSVSGITHYDLRTVCLLSIRLINTMYVIHAFGKIIHRDVRPDNFCIGRKNRENIHLIDFGIAKRWLEKQSDGTKKHMEYKEGLKVSKNGNCTYSSVNRDLGIEQSRRDDLISVGYCIIYFAKGSLPWSHIVRNTKMTREEKFDQILEIKKKTKNEDLCSGLPAEFLEYMNYVTKLKFDEDPDYISLFDLFIKVFERKKFADGWKYTWDFFQLPPITNSHY